MIMDSAGRTLRNAAFLGAIALAHVSPVLAQEEQGDELEEVIVTGSYLYTGIDSPSPVSVHSGEDMVEFAPPDLATYFFDNVPQNFSSDNIDQTDAGGMARTRSTRVATINLRGLGDENSLTVLNGRRVVAYPAPDGTGWNRVDINSLVPRIAVQRAELLLDGGSAIFGSDPVAGVVNFVTNRDFRGFDFQADSRTLEADPAANVTFAGLFGAGNENTSFIAAVEYHMEDMIRRGDIDDVFGEELDVTPEGGVGLESQAGLTYVSGMGMGAATWIDPLCGNPVFGQFSYYRYYEDPADDELREVGTGSDPSAPAEGCGRANGFDNAFALVNNNVEQAMGYVYFDHAFENSVRVNGEVSMSQQRFDDIDRWGDGGTGNVWTPNVPATLGASYAFPTDHPAMVHARSEDENFGFLRPAMGPARYVPLYAVNETMPFLAEMDAYNENAFRRAAFGIEGDIGSGWTWLVDGSVGRSQTQNAVRDIILAHYPLAMDGLGGPNCDPATGTAGQGSCFYYNPFMSSALPDAAAQGLANDPELLEWLIPNRVDKFTMDLRTVDARVTGEFGELPGGPIGLAAGVAWREETLARDVDPLVEQGLTASVGIFNDFSGSQSVQSIYFESALPFTDTLNVQVAARNESYNLGFSELSPKIAALWTPTDRINLRASWQTSFKGPSISQSAANTVIGGRSPNFVDHNQITYGAMGRTSAAFETRANPDLQPQTSDNLSFGFDFRATESINVGASWVRVRFKDRIVAPTANVVGGDLRCIVTYDDGVPKTFNDDGTERAREDNTGNINWIPASEGGCMEPLDPSLPLDQNNIALIVTYPENLDFLNAEFLDLYSNMNFDTGVGRLSFSPRFTLTTKYDFPLPAGAGARPGLCPDDLCSSIGRNIGMGFSNGINNMPHWQGSFPLSVNRGDHRVRLNVSYRDSLNADYVDLTNELARAAFTHEEGQWLLDLQWNWQFMPSASFGLATRNLLATEPPQNQSARYNRRLREYVLQFRYTFER